MSSTTSTRVVVPLRRAEPEDFTVSERLIEIEQAGSAFRVQAAGTRTGDEVEQQVWLAYDGVDIAGWPLTADQARQLAAALTAAADELDAMSAGGQ